MESSGEVKGRPYRYEKVDRRVDHRSEQRRFVDFDLAIGTVGGDEFFFSPIPGQLHPGYQRKSAAKVRLPFADHEFIAFFNTSDQIIALDQHMIGPGGTASFVIPGDVNFPVRAAANSLDHAVEFSEVIGCIFLAREKSHYKSAVLMKLAGRENRKSPFCSHSCQNRESSI